jgi:3-phenylpropionate/cinnamic acid dioxygenase small subunit
LSLETIAMKRTLIASLILSAAAFWAGSALAEPRKADGKDTNDQPKVESKISLTDSVRRVERQTGGEVLSAEPMQRDGRQVTRVKVLTNDGRVRVMQVDQQQNKKPPPAPPAATVADKGDGDPNQF